MAKVDLQDFAEKEVSRIYIADRLREAERAETTLSDLGVDYAVEVEPFDKVVLGVLRMEGFGAAFYVLSGQAPFARHAMQDAGLSAGLVDEETD